MTEDPFLTIAIPTYNRCKSLERQLNFIASELLDINVSINLVISNNASNDETKNVINSFHCNVHCDKFHQSNNIGLIENYKFVLNKSTGTFVWIIGDDDFIKPGSLKRFILELQSKNVGLLHICWGAAAINDVNSEVDVFVENFYGYQEMKYSPDDNLSWMYIAQSVPGGFMFMTANILNTRIAKKALINFRGKDNNLGLPMWIALYSAYFGGFYFSKKLTSVYCRHATPRWTNEGNKLFFGDVPHIVQMCKSLGWKSASILRFHLLLINSGLIKFAKNNTKYFLFVWCLMPFRLLFKKALKQGIN